MGTVIRIILMRYLWREVKVKFWYDVFVCCPKRIEFRLDCVSIAHEGCCWPEQLASVGDPPNCRASPPPGIFLMADVGLERDFFSLFGGPKFAWRQAKGIWLQLPLTGVRAIVSAYTLQHGLLSPRFLSPYFAGPSGSFLPVWTDLGWHILRKLP